MAIYREIKQMGLEYVQRFTEAYLSSDDPFEREIACEDVQWPALLVDGQSTDWLVGKRLYPEVGYSVQHAGMGYHLNRQAFEAAALADADDPARRTAWAELRKFWEHEDTAGACVRAFPAIVRDRLHEPYTDSESLHAAGYTLFRMAGLQLDYGKLVTLGLQGLSRQIDACAAHASAPRAQGFYEAARRSIARVRRCIEHSASRARDAAANEQPAAARRAALEGLLEHPPRTFHEALQLVLLTSAMSGTINFGRLDVSLGPILCRELDAGTLTWEHALELMENFYVILEQEIPHFDARIIVGGVGRPSHIEADADRFAMLAMETTHRLSLPMPQLSLRFHDDQNPDLLRYAYEVLAEGKTFPMLYNDSVNVPAVETAFGIDRDSAEQYAPFGCGEYMIDHASCGTPNALLNVQRCLESAINHGRCLRTARTIGPDLGGLDTYRSFDEVWAAYAKTVDWLCEPLALAQASIYQTVGPRCPFSFVSMLYDDCIERGAPIFDGGIRYLGGTNETYGNTNAADSLTAIKQLIFERSRITGKELLRALRTNWADDLSLRRESQALTKYGTDEDEADAMLMRVHEQVCRSTSASAVCTPLHHFLVVVINNNHNTLWGKTTSASADGRVHGAPLAPGNTAGAGHDRSGITALLNSQAKPDPAIHAGAVQNVRLSASFVKHNPASYRALLDTYFERGGAQAMLTVACREDFLAAMERPEEYQHLLVRVGGFSARFVDLDLATRQEILSRTEHGA